MIFICNVEFRLVTGLQVKSRTCKLLVPFIKLLWHLFKKYNACKLSCKTFHLDYKPGGASSLPKKKLSLLSEVQRCQTVFLLF